MSSQRKMHLGLSIQSAGYHYGAWRLPGAPANPDTDIAHYVHLAQVAERAKFDMVFFADWLAVREDMNDRTGVSRIAGIGRLEPITALSALSAHTSRIGLTGTISTTFSEPYQVARVMASLDHISHGRAGWNVVTSWSDEEARNFGADHMLAHPLRYARAREFLDVVFGLWDGWDQDAFVRDKKSGVYFDPDKVRLLNHVGPHFSVRGPLNMEPPPQGRPVISQAGQSHDGQALAAATADMIFAPADSLSQAQAYYARVKALVVAHGRSAHALKIMPGVMPIVGRTAAQAQARYDELASNIDENLGRALMSSKFGDLRGLPVDEPIPNPPRPDASGSMLNTFYEMAAQGRTIREIYQQMAMRTWKPLIGTPEQVADHLEAWFLGGAADGFNILCADAPEGVESFAELVVPILQARGLFRTEYEGRTLREHLGLGRPDVHRGQMAATA